MPLNEFAACLIAAVEFHEPPIPLWAMELSLDVFLGAWLFFVGASVGSFLNVVVYRLPRGLNLVHPPSRCPSCLHAIRLWDNVPILSWLLLGGKCRDCRAPVSSRYFWIELLMGSVFLGIALVEQHLVPQGVDQILRPSQAIPFWLAYVSHVTLVGTLITAALIDADGFRTPWRLFVPAIAMGLILPWFWPELRPYIHRVGQPAPLSINIVILLTVFGVGWAFGVGRLLVWSWQWHRSKQTPRFAPHAALAAAGATLGVSWSFESPLCLVLFLVVLIGLRLSRSIRVVPFAAVVLFATLPRLLELDVRLLGEALFPPNLLISVLMVVGPIAAFVIPLVAPPQYLTEREPELPPPPGASTAATSFTGGVQDPHETDAVPETTPDQTPSPTIPP